MTAEKISALKKKLVKDGNMLRIYRYFRFVPDAIYLKIMFRLRMGYPLCLSHPETFNQKLNYLKLHDRKPVYTKMVDKLAVNEIVRQKCGSKLGLINIIGVYDRAEDIDWSALPEKFVLKCTHDSGSAIVCENKSSFDRKRAKEALDFSMKHNYFYAMREWPYKNAERKIIAQEYIEELSGGLTDYKIFTFGGEPGIIYIRSSAGGKFFGDYFTIDGEHLDFTADYPNSPSRPAMPASLDQMLEYSRLLSEGTVHLRVDFYEIKGVLYFGELTFYHDGGFAPFSSREWDRRLGDYIKL